MRKVPWLWVGLVLIASCQKQKSVRLKIDGMEDQSVLVQSRDISSYPWGGTKTDTLEIKDGELSFDVQSPMSYLLIAPAKYRSSLVDNHRPSYASFVIELIAGKEDKLEVTGRFSNDNHSISYTVHGNKLSEDLATLRASYLSHAEAYTAAKNQMQVSQYNAFEPVAALSDKARRQADSIDVTIEKYVTAHPDDKLAGFLMIDQSRPSFLKNYKMLSESVKGGIFKGYMDALYKDYKEIDEILAFDENLKPGSPAPNFKLQNANGSIFELYKTKAKYILLDFWMTWSPPSVEAFQRLKKYKDKVDIVSIVCDDNPEKWREIIKKQSLSWTHLASKKMNPADTDLALLYAVSGYPTRVLIDKNKKIAFKFVGESADFYQKMDQIIR